MQITCVAGLPGSGKSTFITNTWNEMTDLVIDDPGTSVNYCLDFYSQNRQSYPNAMLWVADPYFCIPEVRAQAEKKLMNYFGVQPGWIFFENDPEACMKNVARRMDGRKVRGLIHALKSRYQIPPGAHVIPVWRPET